MSKPQDDVAVVADYGGGDVQVMCRLVWGRDLVLIDQRSGDSHTIYDWHERIHARSTKIGMKEVTRGGRGGSDR